MKHNHEMLTKNKETWGDKVRIIGLAIDVSGPVVAAHIGEKGWAAGIVEHYCVNNGICLAQEIYGAGGVPHVFLVDKTGKIVFKGHPATRNLEDDINSLLEDKELSGENTAKGVE